MRDNPIMYRNGKTGKQRTVTLDEAVRRIRSFRVQTTREALALIVDSSVNNPVMVGAAGIDRLWLLED